MNYEFGQWHKGHVRNIVDGIHGLGIVCLDCGVYANLEAVSKKISPEDACKVGEVGVAERKSLGKMSAGVEIK